MTFSGTVTSDFLKYLPSNLNDKEKLIDYSAADFTSLRTALINYAKACFPLDYNNFTESDFGTFLIELMAAIGHIQSYKSDFIANESFIRTAKDRKSVKKLLELIGVRMKGPISSAANAKITVDIPVDQITSVSSVTIAPENRTFVISSPEDGSILNFTIYKVKADGTVNLESNTASLNFNVTPVANQVIIEDAVIQEGQFVVESGQFLSTEAVKRVELTKFPYIEKSAQVFIDGGASTDGVYSEEENVYFASGANDKVFQMITDSDFKATVMFGDSTVGLSPATNDSYTVTYRVGGGSRGNIAADVINVPVTVTLNGLGDYGPASVEAVGTLENTTIATGGADAETIQHAKRYAPLTFRRQDRLVTLADYNSFVNTFISNYGSTGKANAIVRRAYSSANIIDVFVLEKASDTQLRKATQEYKRQLLEAMEEKKMLTDEPVVVDGLIRTLDVITTVTLDKKFKKLESEVISKVRAKILEYFNIDNTEFGYPFIPQDLIKYVLDLSEVRYMTVDNIESVITVAFNEIIQLNNLTINAVYI